MRIALGLVVCAFVLSFAVLIMDKQAKQPAESGKPQLIVMVYNISDLPVWRRDGVKTEPEFSPEVLIQYLRLAVDPKSWNDNAEIRAFEKDGSLIISQTQVNHEKVAAALASLRPVSPREATERLGLN